MDKKIKKYLGVDWGERRIGLAVGDSENKISVPLKVVGSAEEIIEIIRTEEVDVVVIGEARKMSNAKAQMSNDLMDFVDILKERKIGAEFIDERLTSKAADALSRDKKTRAPRDAVAAMLILQTYLDRKIPSPREG